MSGDFTEAADSSQGEEDQSVAVVEFTSFLNYLRKVVSVHLHEDAVAPPSLAAAIDDRNNQDYMRKFISDPQVSALVIQKSSNKGKFDMGEDNVILTVQVSAGWAQDRTGHSHCQG